jgi:hypothetical protein
MPRVMVTDKLRSKAELMPYVLYHFSWWFWTPEAYIGFPMQARSA